MAFPEQFYMMYLDDAKTAEIESISTKYNDVLSQLDSHKKQISKLFAVSTEKMRAFSVRSVFASEAEYKQWDRGTKVILYYTHNLCGIMSGRPCCEIIRNFRKVEKSFGNHYAA